ncbi:hypothetical protein RA307_17020 [Xanthobacteraceae bacterium Astr-EGSB]|uniref:hypothetical protein n=1 Tax=Astrobacterium formosum TaxID=3069710 RepID=UPI0027B28FE4|nr:hypothetical protein [Xanthobacteraceae bacterium Astr-EGSB]
MAQEPVRTKLKRALIATGAMVLVVASSGLACAADDDDDDDAPDIKFFRSVLGGLGLKGPNDSQIEYRERSPLVLPPSVDQLPPPAAEAQPSAANWPVDQDVQRRREAREVRKKQGNRSKDWETDARALRPDQMTPGAGTAAARRGPGQGVATSSKDEDGRPLTLKELGYKGGIFGSLFGKGETETAKFTREPERSSLTDPPAGYRTPSSAQPYGLVPDSAKPKKATSYIDQRTAADEGKQ